MLLWYRYRNCKYLLLILFIIEISRNNETIQWFCLFCIKVYIRQTRRYNFHWLANKKDILFYPLGHQHYTKCDPEYRLEEHPASIRVVLPPSVSVSTAVLRNIGGRIPGLDYESRGTRATAVTSREHGDHIVKRECGVNEVSLVLSLFYLS